MAYKNVNASWGTSGSRAYESEYHRYEELDKVWGGLAKDCPKFMINNGIDRSTLSQVVLLLKINPKLNSFRRCNLIKNDGPYPIMADVFNHWYKGAKEYNLTPKTYWWHYALSKIDNHLLQKLTNGNLLYSYFATETTLKMLGDLSENNPDMEEMLSAIAAGSELDEATKDFKEEFDKKVNSLQSSIKTALSKINSIPKEFVSGSGLENIETVQTLSSSAVSAIQGMNKTTIRKFLKSTVDYAVEAVYGKTVVKEESLFESDDIEDIVNIENFAHVSLFEDLSVRQHKRYTSFDLYIDDSGSMGSSSFIAGNDESSSTSIGTRNLAHLVGFKLHQMKILRKLYLFSSSGNLAQIDVSELFKSRYNGGTDIKQCIKKSQQERRPAIIITDGEDRIDTKDDYCKDIFFLVLGRRLPQCFSGYKSNGQVVYFYDGIFHEKEKEDSY